MMDRSELVRAQNDTLLDEFQQRLTIQIRRIDIQIAMLNKELRHLESERNHLAKFFPEAPPEMPKDTPKLNSGHTPTEKPVPEFLAQGPKV